MTSTVFSSIDTLAIHGSTSDSAEHAHVTPIFATSAFVFDSAEQGMNRFSGKEEGFIYSRFGNPTSAAAEEVIAALEGFGITEENNQPLKLKALLHSSGQSAMATMMLSNLSAGDTVLSAQSVYGGTHEFLSGFLPRFGISSLFLDMNNLEIVEDELRKNKTVRLIHLETPANPTMECIDLDAIGRLAKQYGKIVTVDNTFATPYLQQPFRYGADYVFHSTTKFLNGHGTAIGGVLIGRDIEKMKTKVYSTYKLLGGNSNPFDAFLVIQGIKTLAVRMDRHCSNAMKVAEFLDNHKEISHVNYNGLKDHPNFSISQKQMRHPGAVLSFELKGGFEKAVEFINKLKVCVRAVSLGTVDTLISHPASMSHAGMSREQRVKSGISDGLVRMSVGIEDLNDIINDLEKALG